MKGKLKKIKDKWFLEYKELSHIVNDENNTKCYIVKELPIHEESTIDLEVDFVIEDDWRAPKNYLEGDKYPIHEFFAKIISLKESSSWKDVLVDFIESEEYKQMNINNKLLTYTKWLEKNLESPTFKQ